MTTDTRERMAARARTEQQAIEQVIDRLSRRFAGTPKDEIADRVHAEFDSFAGSRVRDFIPILVERAARDSLAGADQRQTA